MNTDQAEVEPAARVVRVGHPAIAIQMGAEHLFVPGFLDENGRLKPRPQG